MQEAAERIGFYGIGAIHARVAASRTRLRFSVQLLQPFRPFYQNVARSIREAAAAMTEAGADLRIEFLEDLSPQNTVDVARHLAEDCQAICITSAVHPLLQQAIEEVQAQNVHALP